ncbi:MAG: hypothetical protein QM831_15440 [Kofleriaceae bacterium]
MLTARAYGSRIALVGAIDDAADCVEILDHATPRGLALDLGGVRFINSIGVREWIRMLAAAQKKNIQLTLHRVPVVMVHQFNLVPATRGGTIATFMTPYVCEECDHEMEIELTPAEAKALPDKLCPDCKKQNMVLRDPPAIYLQFLA